EDGIRCRNVTGVQSCALPISFLEDDVAIYGIEAGGKGLATGKHAAALSAGRPGVLHGNRTYLIEDEDGQIIPTHSISAGLDYPAIGRASWRERGYITVVS